MDFLQTLKKRTTETGFQFISGLVTGRKAVPYGASALFRRSFSGWPSRPPQQGGSRDFAAVMAQTGLAATF
jgi:hypothetical protein